MERSSVRKTFSRLGMSYFMFVFVTYLVQGIVGIILKKTGMKDIVGANGTILLSVAEMYLVGFPVYYFFMKRIPEDRNVGEQHMGAGRIGLFFLMSMGLMQAGNLIGSCLMGVVSGILGRDISNSAMDVLLKGNLPVLLFATVVVAPVFEELMYRKLLIDRIGSYGDRTAILVSGVIFGLVHGNFFQFFYACFLGMLFAYIYIRTGKIRYPMLLHMMVNAVGGEDLLKLAEHSPLISLYTGIYTIAVIIMAIAGIVILARLWKQRVLEEGIMEIPASRRFGIVFLNPGMMLFFAGCLFSFILSMAA